MIIVKIYGGLGNQMFQYAAAKALSLRTGVILKIDNSAYQNKDKGETPRSYGLNIFKNITEDIAKSEEIKLLKPLFTKTVDKLYKRLNRLGIASKKTYLLETELIYQQINMCSEHLYLDGYWQSECYFKDHQQAIRACFDQGDLYECAHVNLLENTQSGCSVSIHVRRGDYISNKSASNHHGICSLDYYYRAIEYIRKWTSSDLNFYIFSDDIKWCKENFKIGYKHTFIDSGNDHLDLYLMSRCQHHIIANSSFSWWGAWLGTQCNQINIAPQNWFKLSEKPHNIVPSNWIRI